MQFKRKKYLKQLIERMHNGDIPEDWNEQRRLFGFPER